MLVKKHVILDSKITNNDFKNTNFYLVCDKGEPIYRGQTTGKVEDRLTQHFKQARENPKNKFHYYRANSNEKNISIVRTETRTFEKLCQVEKYEMLLLEEDINKGYTMLNTKKRVKDNKKKEIKVAEHEKNKFKRI